MTSDQGPFPPSPRGRRPGEGGRHAGVSRILIVKLGALGNVVLSFGPFASIRRHHADAHITLLTTAQFADWLRQSPWFDQVWLDERPSWWDLPAWRRLRQRLIGGRFERVYDLQTSGRSSRYFQLLPHRDRPEWSGIAHGCALPDRDPRRNRMHDIDRQFGQLRQAGVGLTEPANLSWSHGDVSGFALPRRFALLVPGSSAHRPIKRWPIERYRELAARLVGVGLAPVLIGTAPEQPLARAIPEVIDLTGRTDLGQLTSLARCASVAIGNDTGPMHLIAAAGCPSVVLFSRDSNPALHAPRGASVALLQRPDLAQLDVETVFASVTAALRQSAGTLAAG
jgi:ADP-heptose:LPS heptosyltransferase